MAKISKKIDFSPGATLTTGETAKICGVSLRTVINWIQQGKLDAFQLPGTRRDNRIPYESLIRFMEANNIPIPQPSDINSEAKTAEQHHALIVDDDINMAHSIERVIRMCGFSTLTAHNGFQAGAKFIELKPQFVTLDLQMPKLDGFSVLEQLQEYGNVKICVISGMGQDALDKALSLGANWALKKPFNNAELETIVKSISKEG